MPYRRQQFVNGEIYHIVLRGIDNNLIFKNRDDYYRGIFSIYEFNTTKPVVIRERRKARVRIKKTIKKTNRGQASATDKRKKLVKILAFCFMPNHIHLLLKQLKNEGVTRFMSKVGTGYGGYFNRKYSRKGYVFQDRFSAIHIKDDNQLKTIFVYIHTNPLSLIEPRWKEKGIKDPKKAIKFLKDYKWSSYADYIGKENFPSVTNREFILAIMNSEQGCREFVEHWVRYKGQIKEFSELALEE